MPGSRWCLAVMIAMMTAVRRDFSGRMCPLTDDRSSEREKESASERASERARERETVMIAANHDSSSYS